MTARFLNVVATVVQRKAVLVAVARSRAALSVAIAEHAAAGEVGLDAATRRDGSLRAVYVGDVRATVAERVARLIAVAGETASRARTN